MISLLVDKADPGQHTETVLKELLGCSESQAEAIKKAKRRGFAGAEKRLKKL